MGVCRRTECRPRARLIQINAQMTLHIRAGIPIVTKEAACSIRDTMHCCFVLPVSRYTCASAHFLERRNTMAAPQQDVEELVADRGYSAGFVTNIESETIAPGLDEDVI